MADSELDIDDLCDTITESVSADDRQTRWQYQRACAALSALRTECERLRARVAELEQKLDAAIAREIATESDYQSVKVEALRLREEQAHAEQAAERSAYEREAKAWATLDDCCNHVEITGPGGHVTVWTVVAERGRDREMFDGATKLDALENAALWLEAERTRQATRRAP